MLNRRDEKEDTSHELIFFFFESSMLEEILQSRNVYKALEQVERNKGAGGVDHMQTDELRQYVSTNWGKLKEDILTGNYDPSPVRKVEIPKQEEEKGC